MTAAFLAASWLAGIVAAALGGTLAWPVPLAAGLLFASGGLVLRRPSLAVLALPCAALVALGGARFEAGEPSPGAVASLAGTGRVALRGVILDEPDESAATIQVRMSVREARTLPDGEWERSNGGVLLRAPSGTSLRYGDLVEATAALRLPPAGGQFDYRDYLLRQGVSVVADHPEIQRLEGGHGNPVMASINSARRRLGDSLSAALPEPQAALARGMLLGQRAAIPPDLADDMNAAGVSHLVAISGYNVSLLAAFVVVLLAWLIGRRQASVVALAVIAGYTLLAGAGPPVVRAAVMGSLFLVAGIAGRPGSAGTSVLLAAAAMTAWQPWIVRDVSFQLTFASTVGIVYGSRPVLAWLEWAADRLGLAGLPGLRSLVLESLAVTLVATAATLPLIATSFHRVSLISLPANLVLVPAFPAILLTSAAVALGGLFSAGLGEFLGWFAWLTLSFMTEVSAFFAGLPAASLAVTGFGAAAAAVAYAAVGAAGLALARAPRPPAAVRRAPLVPAAAPWLGLGTLAVALLAWSAFTAAPDQRLHVTVLDVGEGDAILVTGPGGARVLVDGGPSPEEALGALSRRLGYRERSLSAVILTHPDQDHSGGLAEVMRRYRVAVVAEGPARSESAGFLAWQGALAARSLQPLPLAAGSSIDLGDGARIEVLWPPADAPPGDNDVSVVLRVTWRDVAYLLTADIDEQTEGRLLATSAPLAAQVLKVAHHGSAGSTGQPFLAAVQPSLAVISVGENDYGHPSIGVIDRLAPAAVYRTDESGDVDISTDGRRIWVSPSREREN